MSGTRTPSRLAATLAAWRDAVLDAAFPQTCPVTGQWLPGGADRLAPTAAAELAGLLATPYCPRCGRTARAETLQDGACPGCRTERFWNVAAVVRLGPYEPPLRDLLLGMKFAGHERNARLLSAPLAERLAALPTWSSVDALVPVPMHPLRRAQRPCDHAVVLALLLGERLGVPVLQPLRRPRYRPSQSAAVSSAARFRNVRDCFAARPGVSVAGRTLCLVDNVMTSGATICEVSRVLRAAGARRLLAAVCARTTLRGAPQPQVMWP
ncbi:MAG: ComF family protein [Planctomycetes bacterium]|jgi:competence protein ComFC|nr:ComF family protein [Planctomycetota bacterium]